MSKYINAEELRKAMYNEVFEKDSKLQKWDSGCWIRYKLFVNVLDAMPGTDVVNVIKCKDCKYYDYKETINKIKVRFCSLDIRRIF